LKRETSPEIFVKHSGFIRLQTIADGIDGTISVAQHAREIPFAIERIYYIYNLLNQAAIRGKHAHKELEQALFCINGSCEIGLDDGTGAQTVTLDKPDLGIYLGPRLWHTMNKFSNNCILLALASDVYKESDYIRNYDEFLQYVKAS
jgi:hypothetical protein